MDVVYGAGPETERSEAYNQLLDNYKLTIGKPLIASEIY